MIENIPRISVRMITYNQEKVIERAINSLLNQKEYLYEICIHEDCSKDTTWEILLNYAAQYPKLIKVFQNKENLGIFQNIEASYEKISGDLVYGLSGDDACPDGFFKKLTDFIIKNQIDCVNNKICIYGDCDFVYPDGARVRHTNKIMQKSKNILSLKIRGLIFRYGACYSRNIIDDFHKLSQGRSYVVEEAQDDQLIVFTKENYYLPECSYIYYAEYGVSSNLSNKKREERLGMYDYLLTFLDNVGVKLCPKDLNYIKYRSLYLQYGYKHEKKILVKSIIYFIRSIDFNYGLKGLELGRFINHLKRIYARR